jgi:hypothetical protein
MFHHIHGHLSGGGLLGLLVVGVILVGIARGTTAQAPQRSGRRSSDS